MQVDGYCARCRDMQLDAAEFLRSIRAQKYLLLAELAARNQTLFFFVVIRNLEELAPIIYTPVVGEACTNYDRLYRCLATAGGKPRKTCAGP